MAAMGEYHEDYSSTREFEQHEEIRIIVIGKTGAGKSATVNSLIGERVCASRLLGSSETNAVTKKEGSRNGKKLVIVDTPGLFDTRKSTNEVSKEIMKCIGISSPGPHVVVLVIKIGRISQEDQDTVDRFIEYFGEPVYDFMVVVFTRMDDVIREGLTLQQFIESLPEKLKEVLRKCGNRYIGFNNMAQEEDNEKQVAYFFTIISRHIQKSGGSCYTNKIYREVEAALKKRMKDRKKELESDQQLEISRRLEEIQNKYQLRGLTTQREMVFPEHPTGIERHGNLGHADYGIQPSNVPHLEQNENENDLEFRARQRSTIETMYNQHQREKAQLKQQMEEDKRQVINEIIRIYERKMKPENMRETERNAMVKDASGVLQNVLSNIKKLFTK